MPIFKIKHLKIMEALKYKNKHKSKPQIPATQDDKGSNIQSKCKPGQLLTKFETEKWRDS